MCYITKTHSCIQRVLNNLNTNHNRNTSRGDQNLKDLENLFENPGRAYKYGSWEPIGLVLN